MATAVNMNDPRVKRTRQLLIQAFVVLVEEKHNIHSISVQEITERAMVNRATFYAHFEDKYALLDTWMREKFHRALESQLPASSTLQMSTLRLLIQAVFDFLTIFRSYLKPADRQFEPFFETSLQQELYELLLQWLQQIPLEDSLQEVTVETTAQVISWAIFGPATQWSRGSQAIPAEEMAHRILKVVIAALSPLLVL